MIALVIGYQKVPDFKLCYSKKSANKTKFSVVIPFRNEAENLPALLNSITHLNYPTSYFELLFVDDESEDESVQIIEDFFKINQDVEITFQILKNNRNTKSPKKDAITTAVKNSKNSWIITTDADCILPLNWLNTFDLFIQKNNPNMVAGPVSYLTKSSLVNFYQQFDNYSLQATTIGSFGLQSPLLSNGANLAYKKDVFIELNGFAGNDHIASGDDIFLLEKFIKKDLVKVQFVKSIEALVKTNAVKSWEDIIRQRIRWASKTSKQKNRISTGLGLLVFMTNLMILLLIYLSIVNPIYTPHLAVILVLKFSIDSFIMNKHSRFFSLKFNWWSFYLCEIIYPFITVIVVLGSFFGTYTWKNRTFKK